MAELRRPGAWLDGEMSKEEADDFVEMSRTLGEMKEKKEDADSIIKAITPYLNGFMHLWYLLIKNEYGLTASDENGVTTKDGKQFDIVSFTVDFCIARLTGNELLSDELLPHAKGIKARKIDIPLDKVNAKVWTLLEKDMHGQIAIAMEKRGSKKQISAYYSIDFEALKEVSITKKLDAFDRRVYIAIAALYNAGNQFITIPQTYDAMGYVSRPGTADINKISASISKMAAAHIFIDNSEEAREYKYDKFVYDASLLPMERVQAVINGQTVEAIHPFREPPLVSFARGRKQLTTIDKKLLTSPLNKTNQNIEIEDYLLERIAHAKKGELSSKILYSAIFKEAHITGKQRQRTPTKVKSLLDFYVSQKHIKSYKIEEDGVSISW